jgi:CHAD domain-containing protein
MRDAIGTHWAAVWKAMPAVMAGEDPEAVHKVRVASRRLGAAMDVAADCFPRKWYRPLHKTAKRITRALGDVRDRDVMLEALARDRERATDPERRAIDHLIAGVKRDRKRARKEMVRFLAKLDDEGVRKETKRRFPRSKRARAVKGDTRGTRHPNGEGRGQPGQEAPQDDGSAGMSRRVPLPSLDPEASLETNARRVLAVRVDELFRYGPIIPDAEASEALHDARIATKRLRYTLELFRLVFQDDGERAIEQLKDLQEELGVLHDHDVRIALIVEELSALGDNGDGDASELRPGLKALLQRERNARATCHAAVVERWRRLEREQFQARLRALPVEPG